MQRCSICTLMLTGDVLARAADVWHVLAHEHNHAHTLAERRDNSLDSTLVVARAAALYDLSRKSLLYPGMSNCERLATSSKMAPNSSHTSVGKKSNARMHVSAPGTMGMEVSEECLWFICALTSEVCMWHVA